MKSVLAAALAALLISGADAQETARWNGGRFALPAGLCGALERDGAYRVARCGSRSQHPEYFLFTDMDQPQSRAARRQRLDEMVVKARTGGMDDMFKGFARRFGACTITDRQASVEAGRIADHFSVRVRMICRSLTSATEVKAHTMATYVVASTGKQIMVTGDYGNMRDPTESIAGYRALVQNVVTGVR